MDDVGKLLKFEYDNVGSGKLACKSYLKID